MTAIELDVCKVLCYLISEFLNCCLINYGLPFFTYCKYNYCKYNNSSLNAVICLGS